MLEYFVEGDLARFTITEDRDDNFSRSVEFVCIDNEQNEIRVECINAIDLTDINFTFSGTLTISITDISDRGWERQNYLVDEIAGHRFSFYCEKIRNVPFFDKNS